MVRFLHQGLGADLATASDLNASVDYRNHLARTLTKRALTAAST